MLESRLEDSYVDKSKDKNNILNKYKNRIFDNDVNLLEYVVLNNFDGNKVLKISWNHNI